MRVVLFCGGMGLRLREADAKLPKPLIPVGDMPILLHLMKFYAHYGHREFILCLGHHAHAIKEYFLNYNEALQNDFVLQGGGQEVRLLKKDMEDWQISFVYTGRTASVDERLLAVREYLAGEEYFPGIPVALDNREGEGGDRYERRRPPRGRARRSSRGCRARRVISAMLRRRCSPRAWGVSITGRSL